MIFGKVSLDELDFLYRNTPPLSEMFVFPWRQYGHLVGAVTGFIDRGDNPHAPVLRVEHMIVSRQAQRKFAVMMEMSEAATQAAFATGCCAVVLWISGKDPRRSGLRAWAKRLNYSLLESDSEGEFYIRKAPTDG